MRRPSGYGCSAVADELVGDVGPVVLGRVDVVDAELDGAAQDGDRRGAVARRPEDARARELHGAEAHAVDGAPSRRNVVSVMPHTVRYGRRSRTRGRSIVGASTTTLRRGTPSSRTSCARARAQVTPERRRPAGRRAAGARPACAARRSPQLAGVGLSWYTWLEQGRDIHPSPQVPGRDRPRPRARRRRARATCSTWPASSCRCPRATPARGLGRADGRSSPASSPPAPSSPARAPTCWPGTGPRGRGVQRLRGHAARGAQPAPVALRRPGPRPHGSDLGGHGQAHPRPLPRRSTRAGPTTRASPR